jgi:hypothetical protein
MATTILGAWIPPSAGSITDSVMLEEYETRDIGTNPEKIVR